MVLANDMIGEQQQQSSSIHHQLQRSSSPNTSLTSSSSSPSSQAMATEQISLYELRELATRQQERIETTQRLIMNREQKLKYIKHDTLLNHSINEYDQNLQRLKDSVSAQEIKLRQLRALKGQVQKQRCSNSNLCSELESIRTLFNEKEKELSVALTKVDALTRQLEELRKGNTTNSYHINGISNGKHGIELEKLRQELLYRTKLNEQQNQDLIHKKGLLTQRQSEMVEVDKRISELQQRLARKRQLNQQLSSQMHSNISRSHGLGLGASGHHLSNSILRSSIGHPGHGHKISHMRPLSANIAAVEPMVQREQNRISEIDQHFHANKDFMGCKQDPKYQTLPYNTKFGVRQHQPLYKMTAGNHLSVSTAETDKNDYELSNDNMNDILMANISNNVLNNNNTNKSGITNKNNSSYSKLMTTKSSFVEERPSPSGSSGSSDRASIQNHNGINSLKMQQNQNNNMNGANAQHYSHQNQSQKMIGMPFVDNGNNVKQLKSVNFNSNQSASHDYSVPTTSTSSQTQSQLTSNHSKVPLNTKPKPSLPPKPSIPVKPIPPPRQTPNHSYSAQIHSDSLDNAFSMSRSNPNVDRKSTNLLTTSNTPSTSSSVSYRFPLTSLTSMTIQRPYNVINSKTGLMAQQLPHNSQHQQQQHQLNHHSYEDKIPSHSNRNTESLHQLSIGNLNESTDGPNFNGHTLTCTDLTSSTSSLSSSLSSQNNANCDTKSIVSISSTSTNTTDNNISVNSNSFSLKNESKNEINNYKNNNSSVPSVTNTSNNSSANDWHKVKRRPVVANNEIEKELALQISVASKKTSDTNLNSSVISQTQSQQFDSTVQQSIQSGNKKVGSNLSIHEKHTNQCELKPNKLDKSVEKDNNSETNLIKEQQKEELSHEPYNSNLMIENFKEKDHHCDEEHIVDNVSNHTLNKSIGASKRTKGNLKSQQMSTTTKGDRNISNSCQLSVSRRVSFDPLALLLDAALEGELELVKKTANEVPNPSAANDEGITALHNAICAGHFDIVKYLVENGCDVNAQDSDGWTPLHCAASCNNLAMVKFLVKNGACIFATTLSDQETAAEKCEEDEEGFDGCSQYLYGVQEKLGVYNGSAVYAVYDYDSQNSDEMSFREGNIIIIMRKGDEQEREWWWAKIKDREGYVPRNLLGLYPRVKSNKELQTINEEQCE